MALTRLGKRLKKTLFGNCRIDPRSLRESFAAHARAALSSEYSLWLLVIVLFSAFMSLRFFYGPSPINGADNYIYTYLGYRASTGDFRGAFQGTGVLAQQYILVLGIALFDFLFSPGRLSAAGFGILCFALNSVVVYMIGKELYGRRGGALSALAYSFSPIDVVNASYVGDNGPMAFLVSLAVLAALLAVLKRKGESNYYAVAGFLAVVSILTSIQAIEIMSFVGLLLAGALVLRRDAATAKNIGRFFIGAAAAVLLIVSLSSAFGNPPAYIFTSNAAAYSGDATATSQFGSYVSWMFSYNVLSDIYLASNIVVTRGNLAAIAGHYFSVSNGMLYANETIGLYGYFALLGAAYLLLTRNFRALLAALWVIATLLYMGFGSASLTRYVPIGIAYPRLMLIFTPALSLLIGMGMASMIDAATRNITRYGAYAISAATILVLFYSSYVIINYVGMSQYKYVYPLLQVSGFIRQLPTSVTIYSLLDPIGQDVGFKYNILGLPTAGSNGCPAVPAGSYVIIDRNDTLQERCGMALVFSQPPLPQYLSSYTLFDNSGFGVYNNRVVYRVAGHPAS